MAKILSEVIFTKGKRSPGYMITLEDGTLLFYTDTGHPVSDVRTHWLLSRDLGEFGDSKEFEILAGVRPLVTFDLCDMCGVVRAQDGSPCHICDAIRDANPGLDLIQ